MKNMTPSNTTTEGQIHKAVSNYRVLLEKHSGEFDSEAVQTVLGQSELADEMFGIFRKRVEVVSNMIVRHVNVDRSCTPQQILDATGRKQYINRGVVDVMPHGQGEEVDVIFFKLDHYYVSDDDLEKEYELRSLKSADPYSQATVNEIDPEFADKYPNGTHWKDVNGKWCFAAFCQWVDVRGVGVGRSSSGWGGSWRFAGLRK